MPEFGAHALDLRLDVFEKSILKNGSFFRCSMTHCVCVDVWESESENYGFHRASRQAKTRLTFFLPTSKNDLSRGGPELSLGVPPAFDWWWEHKVELASLLCLVRTHSPLPQDPQLGGGQGWVLDRMWEWPKRAAPAGVREKLCCNTFEHFAAVGSSSSQPPWHSWRVG